MKHPVPSITATMEEMSERHMLAGQIMVSLDILCDRPYVLLSSSSIHYRHNGGDARKAHVKHPVPSITATMEEMSERHMLAGQIMVSLDILCDRPYVLLSSSSIHYRHNGGDARKAQVKHPDPSITATMEEMPERHTLSIQFHPLPPQWRGCHKGTREASSSIHYRHNGGDARKAHVGRSNYGESRYFVCFHRSQSIILMSCYHPVPSVTAIMEEMQERHTWAGLIMVSLDVLCVSIDLRVYFLCPVINPLPPRWRRCQKGTREASSSIHYRHNGGDA